MAQAPSAGGSGVQAAVVFANLSYSRCIDRMMRGFRITAIAAVLAVAAATSVLADQPTDPVPQGTPAYWVSSDDYPADAMRNRYEGRVDFVLTVNADGRPVQCEIEISSSFDVLDQATCRVLMLRARFLPARDGKGRYSAGVYRNHLRWALPAESDEATGISATPMELSLLFTIGSDGRARDCVTEKRVGNEYFFGQEHQICDKPMSFPVAYDAVGKPKERRVRYHVSLEDVEAPR